MSQNYTPDFKKNIVRLHIEEGRTLSSLAKEYGVSKAAISIWCNKFNKECQEKATVSSSHINEAEVMKENAKLRKELEAMKKENDFLKKAAAFFAKGID